MQSDISDIWHSSNAQLFYDICNTYLRNMMTHKSGIGVMNSYPDIGIDAEAILLEFANRETHNEVQIGRKNISHFSHLAF